MNPTSPILGELDRHLLAEGSHRRAYEHLGAHPCERDGNRGVAFGVWAPQAEGVAVVGDFNGWDPSAAPMQRFGVDGPWTASVLVRPGRHTYAFLVDGTTLVADPRAARAKSVDYGGDASVMMVRTP